MERNLHAIGVVVETTHSTAVHDVARMGEWKWKLQRKDGNRNKNRRGVSKQLWRLVVKVPASSDDRA